MNPEPFPGDYVPGYRFFQKHQRCCLNSLTVSIHVVFWAYLHDGFQIDFFSSWTMMWRVSLRGVSTGHRTSQTCVAPTPRDFVFDRWSLHPWMEFQAQTMRNSSLFATDVWILSVSSGLGIVLEYSSRSRYPSLHRRLLPERS